MYYITQFCIKLVIYTASYQDARSAKHKIQCLTFVFGIPILVFINNDMARSRRSEIKTAYVKSQPVLTKIFPSFLWGLVDSADTCYRPASCWNNLAAFVTEILFPYFSPSPNFSFLSIPTEHHPQRPSILSALSLGVARHILSHCRVLTFRR